MTLVYDGGRPVVYR